MGKILERPRTLKLKVEVFGRILKGEQTSREISANKNFYNTVTWVLEFVKVSCTQNFITYYR